jgi:hypothetical protein
LSSCLLVEFGWGYLRERKKRADWCDRYSVIMLQENAKKTAGQKGK